MRNKDYRFIESVYKICISLFKYKPTINIEQFFSAGFADQKVIMVCEIIDHVKKMLKHQTKTKPSQPSNPESSFSKRSASLKPRKLDLKEEPKTQI